MDITSLLLMMLLRHLEDRQALQEPMVEERPQLPAIPPAHGPLGQTPNPAGFLHGMLMGPIQN